MVCLRYKCTKIRCVPNLNLLFIKIKFYIDLSIKEVCATLFNFIYKVNVSNIVEMLNFHFNIYSYLLRPRYFLCFLYAFWRFGKPQCGRCVITIWGRCFNCIALYFCILILKIITLLNANTLTWSMYSYV